MSKTTTHGDTFVNTTMGTWQVPDVVRWTSVPPTATGWHWWRFNHNETAEVILVGHTGRVRRAGYSEIFEVINATEMRGEWWPTPIEPPNV